MTKAGERPACLVAQEGTAQVLPTTRGKAAHMQPTDGELPDGRIKLITSEPLSSSTSPTETTRLDVPPKEATGNTQHR